MADNKRPESMERITTPELAQAFIDEQVEEEESAREMIAAFEAVENNKYGMYMLDKELATRVYNVPSPLATAE
jgi:ferritin